jgi:tRNA(Ile2) C34 agmatinyltransferase TiaS
MREASRCTECGGQLASTGEEVYCIKCGLVTDEESMAEEVAI